MAIVGVLALALALAGCAKDPEVIPGDVKSVGLVVKLAALQQGELDTIGSFSLTLIHNGQVEREVPLSFSSSSRTLAFLEEPADLPTTGTLSAALEARDVLGQPLDIGGRTGTVNLDNVRSGDEGITLFALVSRIGSAVNLDVTNDVGANVSAAGVGTGMLLVGDDGVQWIDLAAGTDCTSSPGNDGCGFGAVSLPQNGTNVVVTALSDLGPTCTQRGNALITRETEAWVFDPTDVSLTKLSITLQTRDNGVVVPAADCRVLVAGGAVSTDIIAIDGTDPDDNINAGPGPAIGFARGDEAAAATGNALGEVLVIGENGAAVVRTAGDVEVCSLSDSGCNGAEAAPTCTRERPLAARLDDDGDLSPVLIFGGDCAAPEVFRSAAESPFGDFLDVGAPEVPRRDGATLTSIAGGALLAGGTDVIGGVPGDVTRNVSFFALDALSASTASGTWTSLGNLGGEGRTGHAATVVGGAVVMVGGTGSSGAPVVSVEVVVPTLSGE